MSGIEKITIIEDRTEELVLSSESEEEISLSEEIEEEISLVEEDDSEISLVEDIEDENIVSIEDDIKVLGAILQTKEVNPTTYRQEVFPDPEYNGMDLVVVNAVNPADYHKEEERVVIRPTTSEQTILPSENKAIGEVFVNAVNPSDYYKPEVKGRFKSSLSTVTYTPGTGKVYSAVTVDPILLQTKVVTENGRITPDEGYDGLSAVRVNVPIPEPTLIDKEITENGTYNASDDNADGYSSISVNVESTGGQTSRVDGKYLCRIYDYDGSLVQPDQWLNEGDVFTLPDLPVHDNLTAQGWTSPVEITDNQIVVEDQDIIIGVSYITESRLTEFDIELTPVTGLNFTLRMNGAKDWGDGTSDTATGHTYTEYGKYTIKCNGTMQTLSSSLRLFGQSSSSPNYSCVAVRFGNTVPTIQNYAFGYCFSLLYCTMPISTTVIGGYTFEHCYGLLTISMSSSIATLGGYAFRYCYSLCNVAISNKITAFNVSVFQYCYMLTYMTFNKNIKTLGTYSFQNNGLRRVILPNLITTISNYAFSGCMSLQEVIVPTSVKSIQAYSFSSCYGLVKLDLSKATSIITLATTTVFQGINGICKIIVPDSLYDSWKVATNWSTYADYIYKASEV